jgi:hypothetical protein
MIYCIAAHCGGYASRAHGKESEQMAIPALLPIKLLGWATAGIALGVGWKVGTYLVDTAMGDTRVTEFIERMKLKCEREEEPLWKRQFSRFSD